DMVVRHKDLLPLMRRSGNRMAQIGIEASNDNQRDGLNKQLRTDTVQQAARLLRQNDIVCQGMFIMGLPDDSLDTLKQKVQLVKQLDIDFPVFVFYTLFPGTPTYNEAVAQGKLTLPADYRLHDMGHVLMPTAHLTTRQVYNSTAWAFTSTYLDPIR